MKFRLDVYYPIHLPRHRTDCMIHNAVGKQSGSGGGGVSGKRDLQFYFGTAMLCNDAAKRVAALKNPLISCVQQKE